MKVSIIVSTFERAGELKDLLHSLLKQTKLPKEVIIVDDSNNFKTRDLVEQMYKDFSDMHIALMYRRNTRGKSLTIARNIGTECARGEIILFLDDDVILDEKYIENILKVYKNYPNAMGVQGYRKRNDFSSLNNLIHKFFRLHSLEKDRWVVLPSGEVQPYPLTKIISCERLSGMNQSYRREIFQSFMFDEKLKRWAYMEDVDFSYRVYKSYPSSLYVTPYARVVHKSSEVLTLSERSETYMITIYGIYFFYKNIKQGIVNKLIFAWSTVGRLVIMLGGLLRMKRKFPKARWRFIHLLCSYAYALKHLKEIKSGDLTFFNKTLS